MLLTLVLPLIVVVVAGDYVVGEAGYGTLRYLLTVSAGRTRAYAAIFGALAWARFTSADVTC